MTATLERMRQESLRLIDQYAQWCSNPEVNAVRSLCSVWQGREFKLTVDKSGRMEQILKQIGIEEVWDNYAYIVDNELLSRVSFSISNADFDEVDAFLEPLKQAGLMHYAKAFNASSVVPRDTTSLDLYTHEGSLIESCKRFSCENVYFQEVWEGLSKERFVSEDEVYLMRLSSISTSQLLLSERFPKIPF